MNLKIEMTNYLFSIFVLIVSFSCLLAQSEKPAWDTSKVLKEGCSAENNGLILCTDANHLVKDSGGKIKLKAFIINIGEKPVTFSNDELFFAKLYDNKGKQIPSFCQIAQEIKENVAKAFRFIEQGFRSRRSIPTLNPRQKLRSTIELSDQYSFEPNKTYYVDITRRIPLVEDGNRFIVIKLEKIKLEIQ